MQNLGFSHLHLVAPRGYDREQAGVTARDASVILDSAQLHATFPEAIAEMQEVVGLALRKGQNPAQYVTLPQWAAHLPERGGQTTALVFGPEDDDLRHEHLELCRFVVRIPSTAAYPSFNLAQSVLLTLYEVGRSKIEPAPPVVVELPAEREFAPLDAHLDAVMEQTGFLRPGTPPHIPGQLKSLLRRCQPTRQELGVLLALFSRVHTHVKR